MKLLLFLGLLFYSTLFAQTSAQRDTNESTDVFDQKVLYLSYENIPKRVIQGEIFPVTIKTLSTIQDVDTIHYSFLDLKGVTPLNEQPERQRRSKYWYDTFYFKVNDAEAMLPTFEVQISDSSGLKYRKSTLSAEPLNVIVLNPDNKFSHIIANAFELMEYKTSSYDNEHNIVVFVARAFNADLHDFYLHGVKKQGIESVVGDFFESRITYYAVIEKNIEELRFSYFNLHTNNFSTLSVPIIVQDDSVATQTDLAPKDQSKERVKILIALGIAFLGFSLYIMRRKYIYMIVVLLPLGYVAMSIIPSKEVCVKQGSNIYLLPLANGTIFETTRQQRFLHKEGSVKNFVKVKLENEKIGWVANEDICAY